MTDGRIGRSSILKPGAITQPGYARGPAVTLTAEGMHE